MVDTSVAVNPTRISMATRYTLCFIAASVLYLVKVSSAHDDSLDIPDVIAYTGKVFFMSFRSHPIYGSPGVSLQLSTSPNSVSGRLPSWLIFNSTTSSLSGVPLSEDQGLTLLVIKAECVQLRKLKANQTVACYNASDVFQLNVVKYTLADLFTPQVTSADNFLGLSSETPYFGNVENTEYLFADSSCEGDRVIASLVLCASLKDLNSRERQDLVTRLSDFLAIPVASIILESSSSNKLKAPGTGFQMVSAGPAPVDNCNLIHHVEILWGLSCSTVKHLSDFVRVLQHNVDGGRFQEEMNTGIVGWYIASSNSLNTRQNRRRREANHRTLAPTPVVIPLRPTTIVTVDGDEDIVSSVELISPPASSLLSPSSSEPTEPVIHPSSTLLEFSPEIESVIDHPLVSIPSVGSFLDSSVLIPSITVVTPGLLLDQSVLEYISSSESLTLSTSSVTHTSVSKLLPLSQPELSSSISSELADIRTSSMLLSDSNIAEIKLDSDLSLPPGLTFSQISTAPLSVLPFESVFLVTSRAVEIIAFSYYSTGLSIGTYSDEHSIIPHSARDTVSDSLFHFDDESNIGTEHYTTRVPQIEVTFDSQLVEMSHSILLMPWSPSELVTSTLPITIHTANIELPMSLPIALPEEVMSVSHIISSGIGFQAPESVVVAADGRTSAPEVENITEILKSLSTEIASSIITSGFDSTIEFASLNVAESSVVSPSAAVMIPSEALSSSITESVLSTLAATDTIETLSTTAWRPSVSPQQTVVATSTVPTQVDDDCDGEDCDDDEEPANNRPYVQNAIGQIISEQGRLLEFSIPHDVFFDIEDGNTRSLTLSLQLPSNQELPNNFWLYLESDKQILKGLPLQRDMDVKNFSVVLVARDSQGLTATDSIAVRITDAPRDSFTHAFIMKFASDFQQFMRNRKNLTELLVNIGAYFGDNGAQFMTLLDVQQGSLVVSWTNNTLTGTVCQMDVIKNLFNQMVRQDGVVRPSFYRHVGWDYHLVEILYELRGPCYIPTTPTTVITTTYLEAETRKGYSLSVWAHVILPVMIALLVFILIILIIIFCNRRRRQRQAILNAEKEAVSNDRNPIIFPDELEADDPSLKPRDPLVLPTDTHQNVPLDSSPTRSIHNQERARSRDKEKIRSQDQDDEEWNDRDNQIQEVEHDQDRSWDRRRDKNSKRQKDQSRLSGVSASSTLSRDRPKNHYLEEEAGSRNSTLNSTKSLSPEKRHPKNPPPYWQSHSDPPPYRLPPPYLTDNTTQV